MIKAWIIIVCGALCIFQGIALLFTGIAVNNFWIMLCGGCVGAGLGYFPLRYGYQMRRDLLLKRTKA